MTSNVITNSNRKEWASPEFWANICPKLTIGGNSCIYKAADTEPVEAERHRTGLVEDGYTLINNKLDQVLIDKLKGGVVTLQGERKLPASFILLFDETWELARISANVLKQSSHKANDFHFDILSWYIESGGFSPHRDRQPDADTKATFHDDLQPKFITHWIALSDATPENSCLYVIPKTQDPGYFEGDNDAEDPLRRALPTKESFQSIRALPRESGSSLLFTHRIIHWGSARVASSDMPPRAAISFVCSDPTYEKPYIDPKYFTSNENPPFKIRLLLVCAQLLIYYQRFDLPKETIKACYEYCKEYEEELEETYRHKVFLEFVNAMKAFNNVQDDQAPAKSSVGVTVLINDEENDDDDDDDDDGEDAVLEEMLNAEEGGYGEFEDDYDDANGSDDGEGGGRPDEKDDFDDEEEGVSLFGSSSEPQSKKLKTT